MKKDIKKKTNVKPQKLTKHEGNQQSLALLKQSKVKEIEPETIELQQERKRIYTCSCGRVVTLEGETYKRKVKDGFELCSTCSK